jgi:hypothetical protein
MHCAYRALTANVNVKIVSQTFFRLSSPENSNLKTLAISVYLGSLISLFCLLVSTQHFVLYAFVA